MLVVKGGVDAGPPPCYDCKPVWGIVREPHTLLNQLTACCLDVCVACCKRATPTFGDAITTDAGVVLLELALEEVRKEDILLLYDQADRAAVLLIRICDKRICDRPTCC